DREKRLVRVNKALAEIDQTTPNEMTDHSVEEMLPRDLAEPIERVQDSVLSTGEPVVDMVFPTPDGARERSLSFGRLTDRGGRVLGTSCTIMDVTERREALNKAEAARERLTLLDD